MTQSAKNVIRHSLFILLQSQESYAKRDFMTKLIVRKLFSPGYLFKSCKKFLFQVFLFRQKKIFLKGFLSATFSNKLFVCFSNAIHLCKEKIMSFKY